MDILQLHEYNGRHVYDALTKSIRICSSRMANGAGSPMYPIPTRYSISELDEAVKAVHGARMGKAILVAHPQAKVNVKFP